MQASRRPPLLFEPMAFTNRPIVGGAFERSQMTAIAKVLSRVAGPQVEIETLKSIAMLCGVGLFVWLLLATYGLDLSVGFF
jgi:hypothetical protein